MRWEQAGCLRLISLTSPGNASVRYGVSTARVASECLLHECGRFRFLEHGMAEFVVGVSQVDG